MCRKRPLYNDIRASVTLCIPLGLGFIRVGVVVILIFLSQDG